MRKVWTEEEKTKARTLRSGGKSLGEIRDMMGVSKSTVFEWVGGIPRPERFVGASSLVWLGELRKLAAAAKRKKREKAIEAVRDEAEREVSSFGEMNRMFKRALLSMLYWAEGSKTGSLVQFVNVDPKLLFLFITLLRESYMLDESKFRVRLHLHYYHKARKVIKYWSNLLEIPVEKFGKIYWKKRSKEKVFRRNEAGICTIRYNSISLQRQLLCYAYALGDKLAPVAQRIERVPAEDEM